MEADEMRARVASARVGRLATTGEDGRPRVVPFCFVLDGDVVWSAVDEKPKTTRALARLDDIARRPDVTVLVDHYEEDWSRLWWVRLTGTGRVVEDQEATGRALWLLAEKYPQYHDRPPPGPVIEIRLERWRGWSAS